MMKTIDNKYTKWYYKLIDKFKQRTFLNGYFEKHHVIPRSLGGVDVKDNIVTVSAREHYICHLLLTKMVSGADRGKMLHAWWGMACIRNKHNIKINSHLFQKLKNDVIIDLKNIKKPKCTEETKLKMRLSHLGKKLSVETKEKIRSAHKGKRFTPEHKAALSVASRLRTDRNSNINLS